MSKNVLVFLVALVSSGCYNDSELRQLGKNAVINAKLKDEYLHKCLDKYKSLDNGSNFCSSQAQELYSTKGMNVITDIKVRYYQSLYNTNTLDKVSVDK